MKTRFFMTMAAAALVLAACSNDEESDNWAGEIRLSSGLAVQQVTRAGTSIQDSQFGSGENIDVFISESTTAEQNPTTITTYEQPLVYTAGENGGMNPPAAKQPYFPASGNGVNIYAVYPTNTASTWSTDERGTLFTVASDQSTDANYKNSDLMFGMPATGNPVSRTSSSTELTFKHSLSKVTITLVPGAGTPDLTDAVVKLKSVKPVTSLNLNDGSVAAAGGDPTDITVFKAATEPLSGSAVVVPQTLKTNFIEVKLEKGGVLTSTNLKGDGGSNITEVKLTPGYEYQYTIKVNLTSLNVTSTITPWNSTSANGDAEMGL